jgi:hypothetical protein
MLLCVTTENLNTGYIQVIQRNVIYLKHRTLKKPIKIHGNRKQDTETIQFQITS